MKIQIVSDLHIDFGDLVLPGGKFLINAGDMLEARSFGRNDGGLARGIAKRCKRFVTEELGKYEAVFYIPGNHEYYERSIEETHKLLQLNLPGNVWLKQNASIALPDFAPNHIVYGTTLWTDVGQDSPAGHAFLKKGMSDFSTIEGFSTWRMYQLHKEYREKLEVFLEEYSGYGYKIIVVTHHAPTPLSIHPKYKDDIYMNMGFHSDLTSLIEKYTNNIPLWVHGHMHDPFDYTVGKTRVVCNPRGYYGYEPRAKDYKPLEIELE